MEAIAAYDLHQSAEAFYAMTPRQFDALLKRRLAERRQADYRVGLVAAVIANQHRDRKRKPLPYQPSDFFASLKRGDG